MNFNPNTIDLRTSTHSWLPLEETSAFPARACIYFAIDSTGAVQYVGRSINARQRWAKHHKYDALSSLGEVKILFYMDEAPELLPEIEKALIKHFDPPLNVVGRAKKTPPISKTPSLSETFAAFGASVNSLLEVTESILDTTKSILNS